MNVTTRTTSFPETQQVEYTFTEEPEDDKPQIPGPLYFEPKRRYPELRGFDTMVNMASEHGTDTFIEDSEIVTVHPMMYVTRGNAVAFTWNKKYVVHQQSVRSCSIAALAMCIYDMGGSIDVRSITVRSFITQAHLLYWIGQLGLKGKVHKLEGCGLDQLTSLEKILQTARFGILNLNHTSLGAHSVVIDDLSFTSNRATIRDPYHGWMVTVRLSFLQACLSKGIADFVELEKSI